jgi:hypothetical protein
VTEGAAAQIAEEPLADPADQLDLDAQHHEGDEGDDGVAHDREVEGGRVPGIDAVVDGVPDEERPGEDTQRRDDHERRRRPQLPAVRAEHAAGPAQHVDGLGPVEPVPLLDGGHRPHQASTPSVTPATLGSVWRLASAAAAAASTSR